MKETAVVVPNLAIVDGRPCTTSLNVAEVFSKKHKDVLRAIREIDVPDEFSRRNFAPSPYVDERGKAQPMFQITRDGFTILAMGFTGKAAMRFKLAYIQAFNTMESELMGQAMGGERRRVDVNHSHFRTTAAPGGLDIRYTLDLTKVIRSPSTRTIKLLSRLTGVDMADLIDETPEIDLPGVERLVVTFLNECCQADPAAAVAFASIYAAYVEWYSWQGEPSSTLASRRRFSDAVISQGYGRDMRGGTARLLGIVLRGKGGAA